MSCNYFNVDGDTLFAIPEHPNVIGPKRPNMRTSYQNNLSFQMEMLESVIVLINGSFACGF